MNPAPSPLRRLSQAPRLYVQEGFASDEEVRHVLATYGDRDALDRQGLAWTANETGLSSELPASTDPVLVALAGRIEAALGFSCTLVAPTFRFRRYARGDAHPPHRDEYTIDGARLVATAIVYLTDADDGGETFFPRAEPHPVSVVARRGRLALWFNHRPDGSVDAAALHQGNPLRAGEKATIAYFVYAPVEAARVSLVADEAPVREEGPRARRFVCVNDGVPEATTRVLREACVARGVSYEEVQAAHFDFTAAEPLPPGALLFRPAVSTSALRVEQALWGPGVVTFHREPDGVFRDIGPDCAVLERRGISVPRWVWGNTTNRALLRRYVDDLGGLPIVMKFLGGSGGVGVLRIDSLAGLFSTMDHALASGRMPLLLAYIPDATHHRCIVVGDHVAGYWRNRTDEDDFRTHASDEPADYQAPAPEIMASAVAATAALDVELGGVDVLEHPSGRHYVLEVNFPCYFARARLVGGQDVGGAMIDWLVRKAERMAGL